MISAVPLWLHLLGAAIWIGSQVMMFAVIVPSVRQISDGNARSELMRNVTKRFGTLGLISLVLLIITGLDNLTRVAPSNMFDIRYGYIFAVKMVLLALVFVFTALHTQVVGPRLLDLQTRAAAGQAGDATAEMRSLRGKSMMLSVLVLVLSLGILFCAALLQSGFAYRLV